MCCMRTLLPANPRRRRRFDCGHRYPGSVDHGGRLGDQGARPAEANSPPRLPAISDRWPSGATPSASPRRLVMLWVVAAACAVAALLFAPPLRDNVLLTAGLAAALAGAAGNVADRLIRGAVMDFVAIGCSAAFHLT